MTQLSLRIPEIMDKPLREAAATASTSLNEYILQAVRRQMTLDAARILAAMPRLDLDCEGDAL
jgi:uncharacterized protein (DUF1778 family)